MFQCQDLGDGLTFLTGMLPGELVWDAVRFEEVWRLHPREKHVIAMPRGLVETPRWQQAYGADYHYTGRVNRALPLPEVLAPLLAWVREAVDGRLNGLLLNWYEGPGHYIGPHHDSTKNMAANAPIVTLSFGETRVFRLSRRVDGKILKRDFPAPNGAVFVLPYATNAVWKHAVPKRVRYKGRRISVTARAFQDGVATGSDGNL